MQNDNYTGPDPPEVADEKLSPNEVGDTKMALTEDGTKVKFTNTNSYGMEDNRNCEAKVDIETVQIAFAGMGKEELMKFANDPFWIRLRWILFILFWVAWLAMLAGAIIIIVLAPRCAPLPTLEWWQKNVIYRVDPLSFQDSNGDGKGDLQGIESRLDHFEFLGVKTILLDSIYKTPSIGEDNVQDSFTEIDEVFGTMEDFENLIKQMKEKDLKLIMDFIPTYTSENSSWFQKSRLREPPYDDFYIWANGSRVNLADPSNPEVTAIGEPWKYDPVRKQFYHYFVNEGQPRLNFRNRNVTEIIKEALVTWLQKGVDGFRLSIADYLFEDSNGNEELITDIAEIGVPDQMGHHNESHHEHTDEGPKVILKHNEKEKFLNEWRSVLDNYKEEHGGDHRLLLVEGNTNPVPKQVNESINSTDSLDLLSLVPTLDFTFFKSSWHLWALGSPNVHRITSRTDPELIDSFHMITMLMKGTPITYYGEEIGMQDIEMPPLDPEGKINIENIQRSPMQWSNDSNAGFSSSSQPWMPVNPNYQEINVMVQKAIPHSHIMIYKKLVKLRDDPAVQFGKMDVFKRPGDKVLSFTRVKKGKPGYVVLINFGDGPQTVDLSTYSKTDSFKFPEDGTVEIHSSNIPNNSSLYKAGGTVKPKLNNLQLGAKEGVVIKFVPNFG